MTLWYGNNTFLGGYNIQILLPTILLKIYVKHLRQSFFINTNRGVQVYPTQTVRAKSKTIRLDANNSQRRIFTFRNRNWWVGYGFLHKKQSPIDLCSKISPFITFPLSLKCEFGEFCQDPARSL